MKKRIACIILSLAVVFGVVSFNATQAWFVAGTEKHQYLTAGDISYVLDGSFVDFSNSKILPDTELLDDDLTLTNSSDIATQLRVKIIYSYYNGLGAQFNNVLYDSSDSDSVLEVVMDSDWQRGSDNYYYYYPNYSQGNVDAYVISAASAQEEPIDLISSIKYSGDNTSIYNSGHSFSVRVVVESKQAYYVTWTQLGVVQS